MVACIAKKVKDANLVQYEEALERIEGWQDDLARVGPDHLPCLYGEMLDFLFDGTGQSGTAPAEKIRTENKEPDQLFHSYNTLEDPTKIKLV